MDIQPRRGEIERRRVNAIGVLIPEGLDGLSPAARSIDRASRGAIRALLSRGDFTGRFLQSAVLYPPGLGAPRLLLVGLGAQAQVTPQRVRQASATLIRRARELGIRSLAMPVPDEGANGFDPLEAAGAVAEGLTLGAYRFSAYRGEPERSFPTRVEIVEREAQRARAIRPAIARGVIWADATCLARALAMTPGQDLTPEDLARRAREIGRAAGARVQVLGVPELERLGMGALLAVGRGSVHPPRFVVLDRGPKDAKETVIVIGKGITFDTGGISLKPRENLHRMKNDMAGAAAVLALFQALPDLDLPFRVVGLVPAAENMPGGRALKPGDVVRALDGTTIEVTNTDAEGRLVLADALGYARRFDPDVVIDLATLTGAIGIALGVHAAGLFTTDEALAAELIEAGETSGERLWRLPLWEDYAAEMRSDVADIVNSSGGREGGAILGAIFLARFARGLRWAHLDIAGTSWSGTDRAWEPRGPTGFGARFLLEWLSRRATSWAEPSAASPPADRARPGARSRRS